MTGFATGTTFVVLEHVVCVKFSNALQSQQKSVTIKNCLRHLCQFVFNKNCKLKGQFNNYLLWYIKQINHDMQNDFKQTYNCKQKMN